VLEVSHKVFYACRKNGDRFPARPAEPDPLTSPMPSEIRMAVSQYHSTDESAPVEVLSPRPDRNRRRWRKECRHRVPLGKGRIWSAARACNRTRATARSQYLQRSS